MRKILFGLLFVSCLFVYIQPVGAAAGNNPADILLPIIEEAESFASEGNFVKAKEELEEFHVVWEKVEESIKETSLSTYEEIEAKMAKAEALLQNNSPNGEEVNKALGELEEAVENYGREETADSTTQAPGGKALLGLSHELEEAIESVEAGDWNRAQGEYEEFHEGWESVEDSIRSADPEAYESIETNMGLVSASLEATANSEEAIDHLHTLIASIESYSKSETSIPPAESSEEKEIGTIVGILDEVESAIEARNSDIAASKMEEFISDGLLLSDPPKMEQAGEVVSTMKSELTALTQETSYSVWDAAIILSALGEKTPSLRECIG